MATLEHTKINEAFNQITELQSVASLLELAPTDGGPLPGWDLADLGRLIRRLTAEPFSVISAMLAPSPDRQGLNQLHNAPLRWSARSDGNSVQTYLHRIEDIASTVIAFAADVGVDAYTGDSLGTQMAVLKEQLQSVELILEHGDLFQKTNSGCGM